MPLNMLSRTMVQVHGLPPFLSWRDAGRMAAAGLDQGGPADASAGLQILNDGRGTWAFNPVYGQWMLLHTIVSGDTLWALSGRYYGERSMPGVYAIGNIEQNKPLLGPSYDRAVPGDVILIPDLPQPGAAAPSPPPPAGEPGPADPVPQPDEPPIDGAPDILSSLPDAPPPGWPPTMPWPPVLVDPNLSAEPPGELPGPVTGAPTGTMPTGPGGAQPILVGGAPQPPPAEEKPESWWTTTRIALVGGLGLATVVAIVWGATRGAKKPRRAPRRRSAPRRRRRR